MRAFPIGNAVNLFGSAPQTGVNDDGSQRGANRSSSQSQSVHWTRAALYGFSVLALFFVGDIVSAAWWIFLWIWSLVKAVFDLAASLLVIIWAGVVQLPTVAHMIYAWVLSTSMFVIDLVQDAIESPEFLGVCILGGGFLLCFCACGWVCGGQGWVIRALCCPCYVAARVMDKLSAWYAFISLQLIEVSHRCHALLVALCYKPVHDSVEEVQARYDRVVLKQSRERAKHFGLYEQLKDTPLDPRIDQPEDELDIWKLVYDPIGRVATAPLERSLFDNCTKPSKPESEIPSENVKKQPDRPWRKPPKQTKDTASKMSIQQQEDKPPLPLTPSFAPRGVGLGPRLFQAAPQTERGTQFPAAGRCLSDRSARPNSSRMPHPPSLRPVRVPGGARMAAQLEAGVQLRERRLMRAYEERQQREDTERLQEEKLMGKEKSLLYYRTPYASRTKGMYAEYKRAEALYSQERLLHSEERERVYGKIVSSSTIAGATATSVSMYRDENQDEEAMTA